MTYKDIADMADECGLPTAYDHFAEGESPDPPFLIFRFPNDANFSADGIAYVKATALDFELYTDYKDPDIEAAVEAVLEGHGIYYSKAETWISEEKLYEVVYSMEVLYGNVE